MLVRDLCERFWTGFTSIRIRDVERYRCQAKSCLATHVAQTTLGRCDMEHIGWREIEIMRDAMLRADYARASILVVLSFLSRAIRWGKREGLVLRADSPLDLAERPVSPDRSDPVEDDEFLTFQEVRRLVAWSRRHAPGDHALYCTLIWTGAREGELLALERGSVDLDDWRIRFPLTKNGHARVVPIHPEIRTVLRDWMALRPADPLVFPEVASWRPGRRRNKATVWRRLQRALRAAGCKLLGPHGLRHTFCSLMTARGVRLDVLTAILGHRDTRQTLRYRHLSPDWTSREIESVRLLGPGLTRSRKGAGQARVVSGRDPRERDSDTDACAPGRPSSTIESC